MKKLITLLSLILAVNASAQTLETTTNYPTGYSTTSYYTADNTIKSIDGVLYMIFDDMPLTLIKYPPMNEREEYEIPSTVRRICNNAFQGTKYLKTLKFHSTVTSGNFLQLCIGESAFNDSSIENFVVIENDETSSSTDVKQEVKTKKVVTGRYDVSGREITSPTSDVNIITYDDKSSEKVIDTKK